MGGFGQEEVLTWRAGTQQRSRPTFLRIALDMASTDEWTSAVPAGFKDHLALQLGIASASLTARLQRQLAAHRLTPREAIVLWLVDVTPGVTQAGIAASLGITPATISQCARRLIALRWIEPVFSADGKRRRGIRLTAAGFEVLGKARAVIDAHEAVVRARLGANSSRLMLDGLASLR
ncbi:MAG: MarR family winged helix-turn-helix transcriptional regulator [Novosphingobium sp.]